MKKINTLILAAMLPILPMQSMAKGFASNLDIDFVRIDKNGRGFVMFKVNLIHSPPSCTQPGYTTALAFDINEPGGKGILSVVLAAKASEKRITASGTGTCETYNAIEDWSWGYIQ